jgi:hypothetical protein
VIPSRMAIKSKWRDAKSEGDFYRYGELVGPASGPWPRVPVSQSDSSLVWSEKKWTIGKIVYLFIYRRGLDAARAEWWSAIHGSASRSQRWEKSLAATRRRRHVDADGLVWIGSKPRRHWGLTNKRVHLFFLNITFFIFPPTKSSHVKPRPLLLHIWNS